jgi:tetratricopeptide (TPR) repeat protein
MLRFKLRFFIAIIVTFILIGQELNAQSRTDLDLAKEYLRQKEYSKAATFYERFYAQQPNSSVFFRYYIQSLVGQGEYDKAEKIARKYIRRNREDLNAYIELGNIYTQKGEAEKATEIYNDVIELVSGNYNMMRRLANVFIGKRQFDWAEKVYLKGQSKGNDYLFNYELANIYYYQRNYSKMIDSYLELLSQNDRYLNTVRSRLNVAVYSDTDDTLTDILKDRLLKMSQKHAGNDVFNELLIWAYMQDDEFDMALVQAKALDKRNYEDGARLLLLANKALQKDRFDVVTDAAHAVMAKGVQNLYYSQARQLFLQSRFMQVKKGVVYEMSDLRRLIRAYQTAINTTRVKSETIPFYIDLANLYAFYTHDTDSALLVLNEAKQINQASAIDMANVQVLEADVMLAKGDIFDATLAYAAVERKFKNNPIGYMAKLRKATMAFYQCDFEWAQGQVDILKASTSKLIANDAVELSLLISENLMEDDTLQMALCNFAQIKLLIHQHHYEKALVMIDSLMEAFPGNLIEDDALMIKAELYKSMSRYKESASTFEEYIARFQWEPKAAAAIFFAAQLYDEQLGNEEKALEYYKKVLMEYPLSIYQPEARKRLRAIRDNLVN